ncbi:MAG: hypothetical protein AAFO77_06245, partial [Pseudomonadota bacterium]
TLSIAQKAILAGLNGMHYRRVVGGQALEAVGALRSKAFDAKSIYTQKFDEPVIEAFDQIADAYIFGLYREEQLVATLRINVAKAGAEDTPAVKTFPNQLRPLIDQGLSFVDPGRLSVDPELVKTLPALPMYILRTSFMATMRLGPGRCVAVVRDHHEKFYRKVLKAVRIAGPMYPGNTFAKLSLISMTNSHASDIQARYPVFNFSDEEPQRLFSAVPEGRDASDPVFPTASLACGIDPKELEAVSLSSVA